MAFEIDIARRIGRADIRLKLPAGRGITVLVGPSGVGKTSVLNMIAGLLRPDRGVIRVGDETLFDSEAGVDVPARLRGAGYVFQDARLFPHMSVAANIAYGARRGGAVAESPDFGFLGIDHLMKRRPPALSGGEARRVAMARALASNPRFLLLDEPLSSLDPPRREEVMRAIEQLRDRTGLPMLLVTHDAGEAARLGSVIVRMPQ